MINNSCTCTTSDTRHEKTTKYGDYLSVIKYYQTILMSAILIVMRTWEGSSKRGDFNRTVKIEMIRHHIIIVQTHQIINLSHIIQSYREVRRTVRGPIADWWLRSDLHDAEYRVDSNITSFFRFVNKRAIYRLGIISLAHVLVHVTDFPVVNVHVDELSSARIWQHKLCATLSADVNINYFWLGIKY